LPSKELDQLRDVWCRFKEDMTSNTAQTAGAAWVCAFGGCAILLPLGF